MNVRKKGLFCGIIAVFLLFQTVLCFGQEHFVKGEALMMHNKPKDAVVFLENAAAEDPANLKTWLYLGIVYEQLNRFDEAIAAYRKILDKAGDLTASVAANLGNAYFRKGQTEFAEQFYTRALENNSVYAPAYLGRANTRVQSGALRDAVADYELYLTLAPSSSQRGEIERLITVIRTEFAAEERRRLLAEEEARAEAERRQRLLDEVAASLQSAADSSQGLSSGAENVESYEGEFELE
jgi:tetratricopeptide (TPR) repeat protein